MIWVNILSGLAAIILWMAAIVEKDAHKQTNLTIAFAAVLAFIVALNTIM